MLIPDSVRVPVYRDNLIAGMAMYMVGPQVLRIIFRVFVVLVGFLILSGAINTSIIGSTGVLMRIAEDGVLTDWFRRPHRKFGTSYRIVNLVARMQMFTIIASRGNVIALGEAYAFGVIWSFTFNSLAMLVLRWKYKGERGWKVPPNLRIGNREVPIGLHLRLHGVADDCAGKPFHQVSRYGQRHPVRSYVLYHLHDLGTRQPAPKNHDRTADERALSTGTRGRGGARCSADRPGMRGGHDARRQQSVCAQVDAGADQYG